MPTECIGRAAALIVAGMLVVGQIGRVCAQTPAGERVVAIEFDCAAPIDRRDLLRLMPMHVGDELRPHDIEEARQRLTQTERFTGIRIESQPRAGGVAVVAHLVRKAIVNAVRFSGNDALNDEALRRVSPLRDGVTFSERLRDDAVARLHDRYEAEGFPHARIDADVRTLSPGELDVAFRIHEGPPLRITDVVIDGGSPLAPDQIRRVVRIKSGDRFTRDCRRTAQAAIVRFFREHHYYEVHVDGAWEPVGDSGVLRFTIVAGPLFAVDFVGNRHFSDAHLLGLMDLSTRPIVSDGTWRELARRAQRAYQEAGYYRARVDLRIQPGPPKRVTFTIDEDLAFHVAAVEFEGNRGLSASVLRAPMVTKPPSWVPWRRGVFLDDVFDDDLKRLWYLYRRSGYEAAEITDARTELDSDRGTIVATVVIEEGPRTIVRAVERDGIDVLSARLPRLQTVTGAPLDREQVEGDRQALLAALVQDGYAEAKVTAEVHTEPEADHVAASVRLVASPGLQRRVGMVIVQNNIDTQARVILRELPFRRGDVLNPDALLKGQSNVYRLGLFRSVTVHELDGEGERRDVGVDTPEKPAGTFQWGAGYNTRDGFRGFAEISHSNLQGLARRLSLRGEVNLDSSTFSPNEYIANLGFREPHVADSYWTLRANVITQRSTRSVDQFSLERVAFIPAIERSLLPNLQAGFEVQAEESRVFDVAADVLAFNPRDAGRLSTVSVGPFVVFDGRDDPFVPRRGVFDSLRLRYAPAELGSDVPFVKLIAQHTHYVPLVNDWIFVYAMRGGWAHTFQDGDILPIRERFFLGGRTTVRGFGENEIGPVGSVVTDSFGTVHASDDPTGGDLALNLNTELRYPLLFGFGGVVFVDGGGVYLQDRAISIDDFRRSAGLGLRYVTPVGPLSLEYGFKLDRRAGESVGEVHFSIGNIF